MTRITEAVVSLLLIAPLVEALYRSDLFEQLQNKTEWWTNLTPYKLFPTEILYLVLVPILVFLGTKTRPPYGRPLDLLLFFIYFLIGVAGAAYGWSKGDSNSLWLADFRQLFLSTACFPAFFRISKNIRPTVVLRYFAVACIPVSICNGLTGLFQFFQLEAWPLPSNTHFSCGQILILGFLLFLSGFTTPISRKLALPILSFGILSPLEKPVISAMLLAITLFLIFHGSTTEGSGGRFKKALGLALALGVSLSIIYAIRGTEAIEYLEKRFLKTFQSDIDRDLSTGRIEMWQWGLERFWDAPLTGQGLGDRPIDERTGFQTAIPLHNISIELLNQVGISGFVIFAAIAFRGIAVFRSTFPTNNTPELYQLFYAISIWLATLFVSAHFGRTLGVSNVGMAFWALAGVAYGISELIHAMQWSQADREHRAQRHYNHLELS